VQDPATASRQIDGYRWDLIPSWAKKLSIGNQLITTQAETAQTLTIRMLCRRFTRLTNVFSKEMANLTAALALLFVYYIFCRVHATLRVMRAMAAGGTQKRHVFSFPRTMTA